MKPKHRHELKTNELAEWLSNLPQWTKKNLRTIIYVSVPVVLVAGLYSYYRYQKDVVSVRKQIELTTLITQLPQNKMQILRSQVQGFDSSYMLLQTADSLQAAAQNADDDQMAALALIKKAEVLRAELHYRLGTVAEQEVIAQINKAKTSYTEALGKASGNRSLMAAAKFGLGLCEEELGNFEEAEQIYRQTSTNPDFEGTAAAVQAKLRLETMSDYQKKVVFKAASKQMPAHIIQPPIELTAPAGPQMQRDAFVVPDTNIGPPNPLPSQ